MQALKEDGTIDFLAEDVPALGYKVYYLTHRTDGPAAQSKAALTQENGITQISND